MLVAGSWASVHPEQAEAIITVALAIVGSIGAFMPDKSQRNVAQDSNDYKKSVADEQKESSKENNDASNKRDNGDRADINRDDQEVASRDENRKIEEQGKIYGSPTTNTWRVEQRGNDFEIVRDGFGDRD